MANEILRAERAHSINGVTGRAFNVIGEPGASVVRNQKWLSESRLIKGYRTGAMLTVEMRFDDQCGNRHNTFSITADVRVPGRRDGEACGCLHDDIARVFPELAPLIRWHLVSTDGPMHYEASTIYHAGDRDHNGLRKGEGKERDLSAARECAVWPEATDAELCAEPEELRAMLRARLPALLAAFRADMEAAGFMWTGGAA